MYSTFVSLSNPSGLTGPVIFVEIKAALLSAFSHLLSINIRSRRDILVFELDLNSEESHPKSSINQVKYC